MVEIAGKVHLILRDAIGYQLLSKLTAIRTEYVDSRNEHSGTGLLLSYGPDCIYCLTANHVVEPSAWSTPVTAPVLRTGYSHQLAKNRRSPVLAFRHNYFRSKDQDLAILESRISGHSEAGKYRPEYLAYKQVVLAQKSVVLKNDTIMIVGLPTEYVTSVPASGETIQGSHAHFVSAEYCSQSQENEWRYEIPFEADVSPAGMSGSPAWIIRATENPAEALDHDYVLNTPEMDLKLQASFGGLVVEHLKESKKLVVVHPGVCAEFAKLAEERMQDLRHEKEDEIIQILLTSPY